MQIDFHYSVTYVAARLAKFTDAEAKTISYSAQYVDDATNSGTINFRNKAMYSRISSAHKMLDYRNFKELANHFVWVPFHFLPGNGGKRAGENPNGDFVNKLVCTPDSFIADDMMESCYKNKDKEYTLHRLGISLHVLADTFAHQGFCGLNHEINEVTDLVEIQKKNDKPNSLWDSIGDYFGELFDSTKNKFVSNNFPLGHGGALTYPDMPYLKWSYKNGFGKKIKRDNTKIFLDAVIRMHEVLVKHKKGLNYELTSEDKISKKDLATIKSNFLKFKFEDAEERNESWIKSIAQGSFSFGKIEIEYIPKGKGSWKYLALDTKKEVETRKEKYRFKKDFMSSDWKLFHDALQIHRIDIIRNILPKYGICVA